MSGSELEDSRKKHDELFRSLLDDREEFVNFIKYFIDMETKLTKEKLIKYNRSFVTSKYQSRTSDIVYKEKGKKIYYLIEHQSTINNDMPFRMLEYSYEIIRDTVEKDKNKNKNYEYPKVIPIVLYTGGVKWKVPKIIEFFNAERYKGVGISFKYILVDINDYNKEQLFNSQSMVGYAMQAEKCNTNEEVEEVIKKMLEERPDKKEEIVRIVEYIFKAQINLTEEDKEKMKNMEVKEFMITVRERIEEYNKKISQEKIEQGIKQGILQRNKAIAKIMLDRGMSKSEIEEITGVNEKELEKIKDSK